MIIRGTYLVVKTFSTNVLESRIHSSENVSTFNENKVTRTFKASEVQRKVVKKFGKEKTAAGLNDKRCSEKVMRSLLFNSTRCDLFKTQKETEGEGENAQKRAAENI